MKHLQEGQSLVETTILTSLIAMGILGLWTTCNERITHFIDLLLTLIASPVP